MARMPKPWWRKDRQAWFVTIDGKRRNLGPDREAAFQRFHELMAKAKDEQTVVSAETVVVVLDLFLEWTHRHRAADTYDWYQRHCQSFAESIPANLAVGQLKPYHVQQWVDQHPTWSDSNRRGGITAIQRAFRWAQKMGHIQQSPIAFIEKPRPGKRDEIITVGEYQQMLLFVKDDDFADLLRIAWETGCRPQEALNVEARHVDLAHSRWVFPPREAKVKTRPRIVYLTDEALAITQRRMVKRPSGKLFCNTQGRRWTPYAVNCRFSRIQALIGRQVMKQQGIGPSEAEVKRLARKLNKTKQVQGREREKTEAELLQEARRKLTDKIAAGHARKFCLYLFRHSFATRLLEAGVDALTVAILLGHANPAMLSTTYQHLAHSPQFLLEQARKAS